MYRLGIIVISYNYLEYFLKNHRKVANTEVACVYVDDQSDWSFCTESRIQSLGYQYVRTFGPKHFDNSINQMNAIKIGLSTIPICDYYWVIDGDDYYDFDLSNILQILYKRNLNGLVLTSREKMADSYDDTGVRNVPVFGKFWIRKATTSQFIIGSIHLHAVLRTFDKYIPDFWYDARISLMCNNDLEILERFEICKIIHGANDSIRYRHLFISRVLRYCRAIIIRKRRFKL